MLVTVAVADDNLHDNGTIEPPAEHHTDPNTKRRRWGNGSQAGRLTWKIARRQIIRPRKELDPQSLHIRRIDLVIESYSEDPLAQGATVAGLTRR